LPLKYAAFINHRGGELKRFNNDRIMRKALE